MNNLSDIFYRAASDTRYVRSPLGSVMATTDYDDRDEFAPSEPVMTLDEANALIRSFKPGDEIHIAQDDERCFARVLAVVEFKPGYWAIDFDAPDSWFTDTYIGYDLVNGDVSIAHSAEEIF